jgi:hypothetical protein
LLGITEGPNFIALDALGGKAPNVLIVVRLTSRPHVHEKLGYSIDASACQAGSRAEAIALHKEAKNLGAFL